MKVDVSDRLAAGSHLALRVHGGTPAQPLFFAPASSSCRPLPTVLSSRQEGGQGKGGLSPSLSGHNFKDVHAPLTHPHISRTRTCSPAPSQPQGMLGASPEHLETQYKRERGNGHSRDSLWAATPGQRMGILKNDPGSARRKRPHHTVSMAPKVWGMFHLYSVLGYPQCVWRRG